MQVTSNLVKSPQQKALSSYIAPDPLKKLSMGGVTTPATKNVAPITKDPLSSSTFSQSKPVTVSNNTAGLSFNSPLISQNPAQNTVSAAPKIASAAPSAQQMFTSSGLPITGDPAKYDGSNAPKQEDHTVRFAGLIGNLVKYATGFGGVTPATQKALDEYGRISGQIQDVRSKTAEGKGTYLTSGMTNPIAQGRGAIVAQTGAAQEAALGAQQQAALQAAQTGIQDRTATTGALASAAGITAPVQVPYSNQYIDPVTGQPVGGGSASMPLQQAVQLQVDRLKNGTAGYNDAVAALSAYGQAGVNMLQQAMGPNFDINKSNADAAAKQTALAQNVQTGLTMQRSAVAAGQALDSLQIAYDKLGDFAKGDPLGVGLNIPILGGISQSVSMSVGPGREAVSAYQGALKEARAQINTVLAPLIGVDSANATSNSLLPDNMTPGELPQKIAAAKEYISQRVSAFTTPGGVPQYNSSGSGTQGGATTGFDW